jgi:hypothetical protein
LIGLPSRAAALYRTLHRLDGEGLAWIAVDRPPGTPRLGRRARPPAPGGKQSLTNQAFVGRAPQVRAGRSRPAVLSTKKLPFLSILVTHSAPKCRYH